MDLDIDIGKLQLRAGLGDELSRRITGIGGEQVDARMRRLERSVLHLERINLEVLLLMQKLVAAVTKPKEAPEP